jgi:tetratricopeptide (TPR) repeat protein
MKRLMMLIVLFVMCCGTSIAAAGQQQQRTPGKETASFHRLAVICDDSYARDTREDYTVAGDVQWSPGQLTISEGSSLQRVVDGGAWTRVLLDLQRLSDDESSPACRLRFQMHDATDFYLQIGPPVSEEQQGAAQLAIYNVTEDEEAGAGTLVREVVLPEPIQGPLEVNYRHGLIHVDSESGRVLTTYVDNRAAAVRACQLECRSDSIVLHRLNVASSQPELLYDTDELSDEQQLLFTQMLDAAGQFHVLYEQGQFASALEYAQTARDLSREVFGEQHPDYAMRLSNLSAFYASTGDVQAALPLIQRACDIMRDTLGEQSATYAEALQNLGDLYLGTGDVRTAMSTLQQVRQIREIVHGEEHPVYALSLTIIGRLLRTTGNATAAIPLLKQARDIQLDAVGPNHSWTARSSDVLGTCLMAIGDYRNALPLLQQASDTRLAVLGQDHPEASLSLNNLASCHRFLGNYQTALPLLQRARELRLSTLGNTHPHYAISVSNLGMLYLAMGDADAALPLLREARDVTKNVFGEKHPAYATRLNNLAQCYSELGDPASGIELLEESLEVIRGAFGDQHFRLATGLSNLGSLHFLLGDLETAKPLFQQAAEIARSQLGPAHSYYAATLTWLAALDYEMGDVQSAVDQFGEACEIIAVAQGKRHPDYAAGLFRLGRAHLGVQDLDEAFRLVAESASLQRAVLDRSAVVQFQQRQLINQQSSRHHLDLLVECALLTDSDTIAAEALWQWKGATTLRQAAYRSLASHSELAAPFAELQSVTRQLSAMESKRPATPPDSSSNEQRAAAAEALDAWSLRVRELQRQQQRLEQQIASASREFRTVQDPLTVQEVKNRLPESTALIDYLEYRRGEHRPGHGKTSEPESRMLAMIVSKQSLEMVDLGPVAVMSAGIDQFRSAITGQPREKRAIAPSELRELIWDPIERHLAGIETVLISPDTVLGTLPFAALPGKRREPICSRITASPCCRWRCNYGHCSKKTALPVQVSYWSETSTMTTVTSQSNHRSNRHFTLRRVLHGTTNNGNGRLSQGFARNCRQFRHSTPKHFPMSSARRRCHGKRQRKRHFLKRRLNTERCT